MNEVRNVFGITQSKTGKKQIPIDGKVIGGKNSIHIVKAMVAEEYLTIGQAVVGDKTNEIPVIFQR